MSYRDDLFRVAIGALFCGDVEGVESLLAALDPSGPLGAERPLILAARAAWGEGCRPLKPDAVVARLVGTNGNGHWDVPGLNGCRAAFEHSEYPERGLALLTAQLVNQLTGEALAHQLTAAAAALRDGGDVAHVLHGLAPVLEAAPSDFGQRWADPDEQVRAALAQLERQGSGIRSGLGALDDVTGDYLPGQLITVGGRTEHGKTAFLLNVTDNLRAAGIGLLYFSQESPPSELRLRLACLRLALPFQDVQQRRWELLSSGARSAIAGELERQRADRGFVVYGEPSVRPPRVHQVGKRYARLEGVRVVVVDHLQRMRLAGKDRRLEIGAAAQEMKTLAQDAGVVVLLASQVARPADDLARYSPPSVLELKEAGEIENESDKVLLVHRALRKMSPAEVAAVRRKTRSVAEFIDRGVFCVRIAKQRDGGESDVTIRLHIDGPSGKIADPESRA